MNMSIKYNTNLIYMLKRGRGGRGGGRPLSLFMASGEGPLLPFVSGGVGPHSPLVCGGVGPLLPFMPGAVGPSSPLHMVVWGPHSPCMVLGTCCHLWMVVVCPCLAVSGWWWWCALVSFCVPWYVALITVVVVLSPFEGEDGGWLFVFVGAPSIVVIVVQCWHHPVSFLCAVITCPQHCMSLALHVLVIVVCPRHVVVLCPPHHCPMLLLLLCPL